MCAKKISMDTSLARHNSLVTTLVTTPMDGKLFEIIDTNYTDTWWKFLPNKSYLNQNNTNFFNNEEEVVPEIREGEHRPFCINEWVLEKILFIRQEKGSKRSQYKGL